MTHYVAQSPALTGATEASLRQYLLDQQVDPVEAQLNQISLEMIKRLDRNRITDRTKYTLEQTVRSGQNIGFHVPRIPEQATFKQVVVPTNIVPNAFRVGDRHYQRFTFDPIRTLPKLPPSVLTFPVADDDFVLSKGYLHKHDVSLRDQAALNSIRERQLKEEIEKIKKLERKQPNSYEAVTARSNIPSQHIDNLANPLRTNTIPVPPPQPPLLGSITRPTQRRMVTRDQMGQRAARELTNAAEIPLPSSPVESPRSPTGQLLHDLSVAASTPRPPPAVPELTVETPDTPPYAGLGKRIRPKSELHNKITEIVGSSRLNDDSRNVVRGHLVSMFPDMPDSMKKDLQNATKRSELVRIWDKAQHRYAESGRTSPQRGTYLPGPSQPSASAPPLETSEPTTYAKALQKGKRRA